MSRLCIRRPVHRARPIGWLPWCWITLVDWLAVDGIKCEGVRCWCVTMMCVCMHQVYDQTDGRSNRKSKRCAKLRATGSYLHPRKQVPSCVTPHHDFQPLCPMLCMCVQVLLCRCRSRPVTRQPVVAVLDGHCRIHEVSIWWWTCVCVWSGNNDVSNVVFNVPRCL